MVLKNIVALNRLYIKEIILLATSSFKKSAGLINPNKKQNETVGEW